MSKVISILSYLGILWVVAFILKKSQDNVDSSTEIHLEQGFGLMIISLSSTILSFIIPDIWSVPSMIVGLGVFIFLILGIINAATDKNQPLPLIGSLFSGKFPFVK